MHAPSARVALGACAVLAVACMSVRVLYGREQAAETASSETDHTSLYRADASLSQHGHIRPIISMIIDSLNGISARVKLRSSPLRPVESSAYLSVLLVLCGCFLSIPKFSGAVYDLKPAQYKRNPI
jgi:hypothetical protein